MVILPGYCTAGTVGSKLMSGNGKAVDVSKHTKLNVACKVWRAAPSRMRSLDTWLRRMPQGGIKLLR